jgi:hypothetical protein
MLLLSGNLITLCCLANPVMILQRQQETSGFYSVRLQPDLTSFAFHLRNKGRQVIFDTSV